MVATERWRRIRSIAVLAAILIALGSLLTRCPANRDGMPGQLAAAMEETVSAARSGAAALDLWAQQRSTNELAGVQLTDARDQIVDAYQGIAELRAEDPVDLDRQRLLTTAMTDLITTLNTAAATVRGVKPEASPADLRRELMTSAAGLESRYR